MKSMYRVEFTTQAGGIYRLWAVDVVAESTQDAREKVRGMWSAERVYSQLKQHDVTARKMTGDEKLMYARFTIIRRPRKKGLREKLEQMEQAEGAKSGKA